MDLLAIWKHEDYRDGIAAGFSYHYDSKSDKIHKAIELGETLWVVTGVPGADGREYCLAAKLVLSAKTENEPDHEQGEYRLVGDPARSCYYDLSASRAEEVLYALTFEPVKPMRPGVNVGLVLRPFRKISYADSAVLDHWSESLPRLDGDVSAAP